MLKFQLVRRINIMASNLLDLTADIATAHASVVEMSSDDLLKELKTVYATLKEREKGEIEISAQKPTKRGRKAKEPAEQVSDEKFATPTNPVAKLLEYLKKQDGEIQVDIIFLMSMIHPSLDHPILPFDLQFTKQFYSQIENYSGNELWNIGFLLAFRAIFDFIVVRGRGTIGDSGEIGRLFRFKSATCSG
jgi:hypothetical protein